MKKVEKKGKKAFWNLALLNPKNLAHEVHVYGYDFSWKSHLLLLISSLLGISAIGMVFKLKPLYFSIVIAAVVIMLPMLVLDMYKRMYEQKRFSDAATYMEQMLYSFQKSGKVGNALRETREMFDSGMMRECIDEALEYLQQGYAATDAGLLQETLGIIETKYKCVKLRTVHELLISSEEYGGDSESSIQILLASLEIWKRRGYKLQADKKISHRDNIISIAVATTFCAIALYVLQGMGKLYPGAMDTSIFEIGIIQLSSLVFVLAMVFVLRKSYAILAVNWLQSETMQKEEFVLNSYQTVMNYDEAREKKKSIIWATPFFVGAAVMLLFYSKVVGIILLGVGIFMLCQHKTGYNLALRDVNQELYFSLPQWLMKMALLLQNNNVQVSLAKSRETASPVIQEELELLLQRLNKNPGALRAYTDFCSKFDVPEIGSCMKILHSISETGTGDASVQISNLIQRVNEMQDIADDIRNENAAFKAKMIFSYPIIGCTGKLLIDLSVGMVVMLGMLGNMGGL